MRILDGFVKRINQICLHVGVVLLIVVVLAAFTQVLCRYVFNVAMPWTEELARMAFNWMCMLGVGICVAEASDPVMSMVPDLLKKRKNIRGEKTLQIFIYIVMLFMTLIIFYYGALTLQNVGIQTSPQLSVNFVYLYASIPVGMAIILINIANNFLKLVLKKKEALILEEVKS